MLVSSAPVPTTTSMNNPRQIAVSANTTGAVMYTVPAGKKFVGYIYTSVTASQYGITPSGGVTIFFSAPTISVGTQNTSPVVQVLVAGTVVTCNTTNFIFLTGVESDL